MNLHLKIVANSLVQFIARIFSAFTLLLATVLITRNLSKEVWGDFVIITSYIGLFILIADFGLNGVILKFLSTEERKFEEYFKNLLGLRISLAIFASFIALALLSLLSYSVGVKVGIIIALVLIITQSIVNTCLMVFQKKLRYDLGSLADILGSLVIVFLVFLAVELQSNLATILLVFVFGNIVKASASLFFVHFLVKIRGVSFNLKLWKVFLVSSLPLGLMLIFSQLNANVDKQVLALTTSGLGVSAGVAVAIYGLSYRIFDFSLSIPTYIVNSAYPLLLENHKNNKAELFTLSKQLLVGLFVLGSVLAAIGWFFSPLVLEVFGKYSDSLLSLRVLLLGLPFFFVTSLLLWVTIAINKEKTVPFIYGFAALANIVLNLVLIPKFGYNAAAWVTIISELLIFVLLSVILVNYFALFSRNDKEFK